MSDYDYLVGLSKTSKHFCKCHRSGSSNAGIHLIKHKRLAAIRQPKNHLARQHHTRNFAAGCNLAQGTRAKLFARFIQKLHLAWSCIGPLYAVQAFVFNGDFSGSHFKKGHLMRNLYRKFGCVMHTHLIKRIGGYLKVLLGRDTRCFCLGNALITVLKSIHDLLGFFGTGKHVFHRGTIRTHKTLKRSKTRLQPLKRLLVKLKRIGV